MKMVIRDLTEKAEEVAAGSRRPWSSPTVVELPRLTELTLQSFIPGTGIPGGGGSTVF